MFRHRAVLAALALLLAAVLPSAPALQASAAPRSRPAVVATRLQAENCAYFKDVLGSAIALDFGAVLLDPSSGGLPSGQTADSALSELQQLAAAVQAASPPAGLEEFHADLLVAVDAFMDALTPAVAAVHAGNNDQAHAIIAAAGQAYEQAVMGLDDAYPDVKQQSDACDASGASH